MGLIIPPMPDIRLWATINQAAANEFAVVVSAVSDSAEVLPGDVEVRIAPSQELAESMRASMLLAMGERVRARGDCVVDVE
jgi:hypothetical protein